MPPRVRARGDGASPAFCRRQTTRAAWRSWFLDYAFEPLALLAALFHGALRALLTRTAALLSGVELHTRYPPSFEHRCNSLPFVVYLPTPAVHVATMRSRCIYCSYTLTAFTRGYENPLGQPGAGATHLPPHGYIFT